MKSIIIKVWPEIVGYYPLIIVQPKLMRIKNQINPLFFDFTNTVQVTSSGLNCFLFNILKEINSSRNTGIWETHNHFINDAFKKSIDLNFFSILNNYKKGREDLWNELFVRVREDEIVNVDNTGRKIVSYPIYMIDFQKYIDRRDALVDVRRWIDKKLMRYSEEYRFSVKQFEVVINEIIKNTADHTSVNAFIGMDIIYSYDENTLDVQFSVTDLGVGINENVKNMIKHELMSRYKFWDITQTYKVALSDGYTTNSSSKRNRGIGMSLILQSARNMNMMLSVFDAKSRGLLNKIEDISHKEIRKNFFNVDRYIGFAYFGHISLNKR
ncbi:MAG: hypothetical protein FJ150_08510 [Euryarchaeota archaeon]|nr:hypothetical protein [Euryarchaeota archaeon]